MGTGAFSVKGGVPTVLTKVLATPRQDSVKVDVTQGLRGHIVIKVRISESSFITGKIQVKGFYYKRPLQ